MKKAMSPLFSTIVLIGFAIALGGVVMSWGRAAYTAEKDVFECKQASLSLVNYGENNGICSKENKLYFTNQNDGLIDLDGIKLSIIGDKEIGSGIVDKQISVSDIEKLEFQYPDIGKIEKIIFIPKFIYLDKERLCPKNGFSIEEVGEC